MLARLKQMMAARKQRRPHPKPRFLPPDFRYGPLSAGLVVIVLLFGVLAWIAAEGSYRRHQHPMSACGPYTFTARNAQAVPGTYGQVKDYWVGSYRLATEESWMWALVRRRPNGLMRWCRIISGFSREGVHLASQEFGNLIVVEAGYEHCLLELHIRTANGELAAVPATAVGQTSPTTYCSAQNSVGAGLNSAMFNRQAFIGSFAP